MITEVMQPDYYPIVSQLTAIGQFDNWEGLDIPIDTPVPVKLFLGKEDFFRFYDITLLAGEWLDDLSTYEDIIINESLARRMGWSPQEAIGKHIIQSYITYTIVGVVKDCHYGAPTLPIPHTGFLVGEQMGLMQRSAGILFKYKEGTWNECRKALEHLYQTECSPENILRLNSEEEVYNNYLRSEEMLTRLLSFASLVCILTAMFGIYSLVTLTCEQRRKEIAIRKVNGATVWSILFLFFREYLIMLCIAALFAFPITYVIIKQWILNYVRQVSISPLPFILILIGLALTVIAGISWRVWKAANENPAEVIKNEQLLKYKIMIKTVNLQKIFKTEEVETWALNNVNLEIKAGEFVAIMGPSGCGKSTLLNILGLLDNPTGGTYELNGTDVSKFTEAQRTNLRKGVIGFVFQSFNLIDELNVFENIELPLLYMGIPATERKRRVEDAMNRMAIAHRVKHFPQQLSGGQQQRVAIARAVVANPKLILADEPTGNLDSKNGKEVMELLTELNKEGTTIVMVTHSQHDSGYAGRTINLFDGQVVNEIKI